jgi:hypothetical protein
MLFLMDLEHKLLVVEELLLGVWDLKVFVKHVHEHTFA